MTTPCERVCKNCAHWYGAETKFCETLDCVTDPDFSCIAFLPDNARFCGVCGAPASDDDANQRHVCTANEAHTASYWDYEWIDFSEVFPSKPEERYKEGDRK